MYISKIGWYRLLRQIMALPMLPPEHIIETFNVITEDLTDPNVLLFVEYIHSKWLQHSVWSIEDISVFKQSICMNNDVEGWHRRLNCRARRGRLPFYLLTELLYKEAHSIHIQVVLVSEGCLTRYTRKRYSDINEKLNKYWHRYEVGTVTNAKLLRRCARLRSRSAINPLLYIQLQSIHNNN